MLLANKENALHKSVMLRVLINILDDSFLSKNLFFKGGSCASLLGYLDRFSIDLDFDIKNLAAKDDIKEKLETIFKTLNLEIKDSSKNVIQYHLKYEAPRGSRNTLKIDAIKTPYKNNIYDIASLSEITRYAICQTKETLFSNKLVALVDRFEKTKSVAGRDLYDTHHFLERGFNFNQKLIEERRNTDYKSYLKFLVDFIDKNFTQVNIDRDINTLLEYKQFNAIRKTIKIETIALLKDLIQ